MATPAILFDPTDEVPDHLICPICMEVPKNKVFQCREGHLICDECYSQVEICPHCRLPFDKVPIRALAIEKMLDELKLECPNKKSGCNNKMSRKSLRNHLQTCSFGIGGSVFACVTIGAGSCDFKMHGRNIFASILHFKTAHKAAVSELSEHTTKLWEFGKQGKCNYFIILNRQQDGYAFLFMIGSNDGDRKFASCSAFYWRYLTAHDSVDVDPAIPYKVKFSLNRPNGDEMTWTTTPTNVLKCGDRSLSIHPVEMPAHSFMNKDTGSLSVTVKVKKRNELWT